MSVNIKSFKTAWKPEPINSIKITTQSSSFNTLQVKCWTKIKWSHFTFISIKRYSKINISIPFFWKFTSYQLYQLPNTKLPADIVQCPFVHFGEHTTLCWLYEQIFIFHGQGTQICNILKSVRQRLRPFRLPGFPSRCVSTILFHRAVHA